jgi:hypothetical protein
MASETLLNNQKFHYEVDAKINACKKLQFDIFSIQAKAFQNILFKNKELDLSSHLISSKLETSSIFNRRNASIDKSSDDRCLDDLEVTLLHVLDSNGEISFKNQIRDLILIMSRNALKVV